MLHTLRFSLQNAVYFIIVPILVGASDGVVVKATALLVGGSRDRSPATGDFFRDNRQFHVLSASKSEYQDIPEGKDGPCVRVTTFILEP
jgi:hypothetical protein